MIQFHVISLISRLFTWIVGHVNAAIDPALTDQSSAVLRNPSVIGVLDIYGFEVILCNRICKYILIIYFFLYQSYQLVLYTVMTKIITYVLG